MFPNNTEFIGCCFAFEFHGIQSYVSYLRFVKTFRRFFCLNTTKDKVYDSILDTTDHTKELIYGLDFIIQIIYDTVKIFSETV